MAKKKASVSQLPEAVTAPPVKDPPPAVEVKETQSQTITEGSVNLDVPILCIGGYTKRRIDTTCSRAGAEGWKAVLFGLQQQEAKLADGKYVQNLGDAVRWVGESVQSQM